MRAIGSREVDTADLISMLMFEPRYLELLIAMGERDVATRIDDLRAFLGRARPTAVSAV
jgi:hypothetical protein